MWVWVARWLKKKDNLEEIRKDADKIRTHWQEVALDIGLDPEKNVTVSESDNEVRVGITEEMDMTFREQPGEWR